jgi:hypothetical protein
MSAFRRSSGCAWLLLVLACGDSGATPDSLVDADSGAADRGSDAAGPRKNAAQRGQDFDRERGAIGRDGHGVDGRARVGPY